MPYSMTGFGRSVIEDVDFTQTWEVRSVNSKHLDLKWRLPTVARSLESYFEKIAKQHALRGRVEISLNIQAKKNFQAISFNFDQAKQMLSALQDLASQNGLLYQPDLNELLHVKDLWLSDQEEADDDLLARFENGLKVALNDWDEARISEGKNLSSDLSLRFLKMEDWLNHIEDLSPEVKENHFNTIKERINNNLKNIEIDENRLLQELIILNDKLDISEEITRLHSHLERLQELLEQSADIGRKLDFTLQECFREINTCGNKVQNAQLSRVVVDFKNELEKCREQAQNIA